MEERKKERKKERKMALSLKETEKISGEGESMILIPYAQPFFYCDTCKKSFSDLLALGKHKEEVHGIKSYKVL